MTDDGKWLENRADESMFKAQTQTSNGPSVKVIAGIGDPLGLIAYTAKMYQGKQPASLEDITDEDRMYYVQDVGKNMLGSPMETVQFTFAISGVTRGFTHQLVRQRVGAAYQQESMRFAVKEDFPVALPPSLMGVPSRLERSQKFAEQMGWFTCEQMDTAWVAVGEGRTVEQEQRDVWDEAVQSLGTAYRRLVETGLPAEEARGLAPTSIMTNVDYTSTLRGLSDHAGMRLCEQAQFEWKEVWAQIIMALREFGRHQTYRTKDVSSIPTGVVYSEVGDADGNLAYEVSSEWQYDAISNMFRPVCFKTGKCEFMSDFDRYCTIREQVQTFHKNGVPSSEWERGRADLGIPAIRPEQWMAHGAAIKKHGDWRTPEQQRNIEGRR